MNVHFVFPPYAESAITGPHLACPLLVAVLRKAGVTASYSDWNIRAVRKSLEPAIVREVRNRVCRRLGEGHVDVQALDLLLEHGYERLAARSLGLLRRLLGVIAAEFRMTDGHLGLLLSGQTAEEMLHQDIERDILVQLDKIAPDIVGISVAFSEQLPNAVRLARFLRSQRPGLRIIVGGSQINLLVEEQVRGLDESNLFDCIVLGNGETMISDVVRSLRESPMRLGIIRSGPITSDDLDELPRPAFCDTTLYFRPLILPVLAQKGCYWGKCTFCDYIRLADLGGRRYVSRHHEVVLQEIQDLHETFAPESIQLVSDAVPPAWYQRLAIVAIEQRVKLNTTSYMMHSPALSRQDFDHLAKAGVKSIVFGTESTNARLLALMKKHATPNVVVRNIRDARRAGIYTVVNAIIDFPTTTYEEALDVLHDFRRLMPFMDVFNPTLFDLTAGTEIANAPNLYGLRVEGSAYVRSDHGFHSLAVSSEVGLTEKQRSALLASYQHLAVVCAIRLRARDIGHPRASTDCLILDDTTILASTPVPRVTVLSLGARRTLPPWEYALLSTLLAGPNLSRSVEELRKIFIEWAKDEGEDAFRGWIELLFQTGLVAAREEKPL